MIIRGPRFLNDARSVSPVVGIALMLGIVVILGVVLGAMLPKFAAELDADEAEAIGEHQTGEHDAIHDVVKTVADGWDDPPERLEAQKAAARAVLRYAREHGTVSKQEAKDEIRPEHPRRRAK